MDLEIADPTTDSLAGKTFIYRSKYGGVTKGVVAHSYGYWHRSKRKKEWKVCITSTKMNSYSIEEVEILQP